MGTGSCEEIRFCLSIIDGLVAQVRVRSVLWTLTWAEKHSRSLAFWGLAPLFRLGHHVRPQNRVDAGLVAAAGPLEPFHNIHGQPGWSGGLWVPDGELGTFPQ